MPKMPQTMRRSIAKQHGHSMPVRPCLLDGKDYWEHQAALPGQLIDDAKQKEQAKLDAAHAKCGICGHRSFHDNIACDQCQANFHAGEPGPSPPPDNQNDGRCVWYKGNKEHSANVSAQRKQT